MTMTRFEIPDVIGTISNNKPTGSISKNAFSNCKSLEEIILPDTIKLIDATCFAWDSKLTYVKFPNKLETIGTYAFYQTALTDIDLPETVKNVYECSFGGIKTLKNFTFNSIPADINHNAFLDSGPVEFHLPWTREEHEARFKGTYTKGSVEFKKDLCFGAGIGSKLHFSDGKTYLKPVYHVASFEEMIKEENS
jgi:hypothetical protein